MSSGQDRSPNTRLPNTGLPDTGLPDTKLPNAQVAASYKAEVETESIAPRPDESFAARQAWYLGGGLAVVVALIAISGFFVMRR